MLRRFQYEIDFAANGHQVVEFWEKGKYDLILMDVQMPDLGGSSARALFHRFLHSPGSRGAVGGLSRNSEHAMRLLEQEDELVECCGLEVAKLS